MYCPKISNSLKSAKHFFSVKQKAKRGLREIEDLDTYVFIPFCVHIKILEKYFVLCAVACLELSGLTLVQTVVCCAHCPVHSSHL